MKFSITLSTGKVVELTESEMSELKVYFSNPLPVYPYVPPVNPYYWAKTDISPPYTVVFSNGTYSTPSYEHDSY